MIGYGTYQTLSGFSFGFAKGFLVSYLSALLGAVACFLLARIWLKARVQRFMASYPNLKAVVHAVDKKGFKNLFFAATEIPILHFVLGTALTLTKIALHVYVGANLTSFAKHVLGEENELTDNERQAETIRMVAVSVGSVLALGVMVYVYKVAKRAVAEIAAETEQEEAMAFLGPSAEEEEQEEQRQWPA
ncbi:hypothetical protein EC973_008833 [Apophysomyces ossiformis]|uniref:Golgi apparatus membrane protein TVP38 n=1 Tax=Apophysomyces ossiformis TaxID=679940 RepID=A0A8H7BV57_9FUNG|nr:hypothetical protein EC973_008833 [Apophysomyces ossiformis]